MWPHSGSGKSLNEKYLSNVSQSPEPLELSLLTVDSKTKTNGATHDLPPWLHPCNHSSLQHSSGHAADKDPRPGEQRGGGGLQWGAASSAAKSPQSWSSTAQHGSAGGCCHLPLAPFPFKGSDSVLHKSHLVHQGFLIQTWKTNLQAPGAEKVSLIQLFEYLMVISQCDFIPSKERWISVVPEKC